MINVFLLDLLAAQILLLSCEESNDYKKTYNTWKIQKPNYQILIKLCLINQRLNIFKKSAASH